MTSDDLAIDPCAPLSLLLKVHEELEEQFLLHQEALLASDLERARHGFRAYAAAFGLHSSEEDHAILPAYEALTDHERGGTPELFRAEHRKISEWLQWIEEDLERLGTRGPSLRREVIALLDLQSTFKGLVEHHSERERQFLYPRLDAELSHSERSRAWRVIARVRTDRGVGMPATFGTGELSTCGEERKPGSRHCC